MTLPPSALRRATEPLVSRAAALRRTLIPRDASLPLPDEVVRRYALESSTRALDLSDVLAATVPSASWDSVTKWVRSADSAATRLVDTVSALAPFRAFGPDAATSAIRWAASALEVGASRVRGEPASGASPEPWPGYVAVPKAGSTAEDLVGRAFGVDGGGLVPEDFAPHRVVRRFAHRPALLLRTLRPHLRALELPTPNDPLTAVCVVGWIAVAPDPVLAAAVLRRAVGLFLDPDSEGLASRVLQSVRGRDVGRGQLHRRLHATLASASRATNREERAHLLVDAYRRVVEGPIRHGGWFLRCLESGDYRPAPMLAEARDGMLKVGGMAAAVAERAILTDLRNGQAHETLEWDGARERYLAERDVVDAERLDEALVVGLSFERGWDAAVAVARDRDDSSGGAWDSSASLDGGMPRWMRAQSAFGANGIDLADLEETPDGVVARVDKLSESTVNPCLQSLLWARLLLEPAPTYRVYEASAAVEAVRVGGADLDAAMPVWDEACRHFVNGLFSSLPLSTFLPANLAARRQYETDRQAAQAAAWIALDDALDAIVGSALVAQQRPQERLAARLRLAILALDASGADAEPKLVLARAAIRDVANEVSALSDLTAGGFPEHTEGVQRLRRLWRAWGPVARLPGVR